MPTGEGSTSGCPDVVDDDAELGRSGEWAVGGHERCTPRVRCRDVERVVRGHMAAKCPGGLDELRVPQALDWPARQVVDRLARPTLRELPAEDQSPQHGEHFGVEELGCGEPRTP